MSAEFSPQQFIIQVRSAGWYILSKWKIILLFGILAGLAGAGYSSLKKPQYIAELTFALDEEVIQTPKSGLSELSEELGISSGGAHAGSVFSSATNILELMQSRLLVEKTLKTSVQVGGRTLLLADFFLDSLDYRDKWMKKSRWYHLNFLSAQADQKETIFRNGIIRAIYETIITKCIKVDKKGKETSIISVTCTSENELFSKYFLEELLNEVTQYYIETKTQRAKMNLGFIQKRTDSVRQAYNSALYGRAEFTDAYINPSRQTPLVTREKQQTDIQILRTSYVELTRSLEAAKTALMRETPLIQYLDMPILPLKVLRSNLIKNILVAFFLGAFLTAAWLLFRKVLRSIMSRTW